MRNTAPKKSRQVAEFSQRGNGCERCDAEAKPAMEEGQQLGGSKTDEPASERASGGGDDEEGGGEAAAKKGFKAVGCSPPQSMDG